MGIVAAMRTPLTAVALAGAALGLSGCLLDTELCGPQFVEEAGRCVPRTEPPAFPVGAGDLGSPDASLGELDASAQPDAALEDGGLLDGGVDPNNPYAPYDSVLVIDRTEPEIARQATFSPGVDLNDVRLQLNLDDGGLIDLEIAEILGAQINDPTGESQFTDPQRMLDEDGTPVSLGGNGAFLWVRMASALRPLAAGDLLIINAYPFDGAGEFYDVYLCPADAVRDELDGGLLPEITDCRLVLADGEGDLIYRLPIP